jgi:Na+/melibiose symporter-like transporter
LPPEANGRLRKREDDDNNLKEEGEKEGKGAKPFIFLARQPDLITAGIVCYLFLNLLFNIFSFFFIFFFSRVIMHRCNQQTNCSILASTNVFGDPCPGTLKYLEAHYQCVPGMLLLLLLLLLYYIGALQTRTIRQFGHKESIDFSFGRA